jgi:voltage-gated potassium channel
LKGMRMMKKESRTAFIVLGSVAAVIIVGTFGYRLIEGWSLFDSLYMTVTTISTVGFREVHELSAGGRVFTIVLILGGVGTILFGLGRLVEFAIGGQLSGMFRRRAVRRRVDGLSGHFIICGFGRMGGTIASQFAAQKVPFVVIEDDAAAQRRAGEACYLVVTGDATSDEILEEAGIRKAKGLATALGLDAGNLMVTLSARSLSPTLFIVSRAGTEETVGKLQKAGADRVVSPYSIGGRTMASLLLKPLVSDYVELVAGGGKLELRVEEFELKGDCCHLGRTIEDLEVRKRTGATILAVRHASTGSFDTNPSPAQHLQTGDVLVAIGTNEEMQQLERLIAAASV